MAGLPSDNKAIQQWYNLFRAQNKSKINSKNSQKHLEKMLNLGIPGTKEEDWKYTPLQSLTDSDFVSYSSKAEVDLAQCDTLGLNIQATRLVFVDGHFSESLSDSIEDSDFELMFDGEERLLNDPIQSEVFLHLTEVLSKNTTYIKVKENRTPAKPLLLMHITQGIIDSNEVNTVHYRHHLDIEDDAELTVIEYYVSFNMGKHFTGSRMTMGLAEGSRLNHIMLNQENPSSHHFSHNDIFLKTKSNIKSHSFLLGGSLLRHNTSTQINGEHTNVQINSLAIPEKTEIFDTRTWLEHNVGYSNSRQLHKTIVKEEGKAVFSGLIKVEKHAINTDGKMSNSNLLLGNFSEVDSKPQLEIYADEVKCSHSATVGCIDEEQIFYLRSRGVRLLNAQKIVLHAFAADLTECFDSEFKNEILSKVGERLTGKLL